MKIYFQFRDEKSKAAYKGKIHMKTVIN